MLGCVVTKAAMTRLCDIFQDPPCQVGLSPWSVGGQREESPWEGRWQVRTSRGDTGKGERSVALGPRHNLRGRTDPALPLWDLGGAALCLNLHALSPNV